MTRDEADVLAKRIINLWRGGPPLAEWRDELEHLDAGRAGTAFARCKRNLENAPSIARFMAEYNSLHTDDASTKSKCGWCGGGWVETAPFTARGQVYAGWEPCTRCDDGHARQVSELWTKSPVRQFITDAEAERLIAATRARHPSNSKAGAS